MSHVGEKVHIIVPKVLATPPGLPLFAQNQPQFRQLPLELHCSSLPPEIWLCSECYQSHAK